MLLVKSEVEEKLLFWEFKFYAVDLGIRLLQKQNPLLVLYVSINPGNAIAHYPGKWGRNCLLSGHFNEHNLSDVMAFLEA